MDKFQTYVNVAEGKIEIFTLNPKNEENSIAVTTVNVREIVDEMKNGKIKSFNTLMELMDECRKKDDPKACSEVIESFIVSFCAKVCKDLQERYEAEVRAMTPTEMVTMAKAIYDGFNETLKCVIYKTKTGIYERQAQERKEAEKDFELRLGPSGNA